MSFWKPEHLRTICGGTFMARPEAAAARPIDGLAIDSRTLRPGQVFLALRGERFDGHAFLRQAALAGSPLLIIDRPELAAAAGLDDAAVILAVPDTRRALLKLAAAYRKSLDSTKVVAICGSNGKTTTTRLIHAILSTRLRGTCSAKSFNNDIGVPLTLLAARPGDHYVLCEVGSNAPGEIAALAEVVSPDVAVITSIGREHLEKLGSLAGVAREEAAVIPHIRPGGLLVATADSPELAEHLRAAASAVVTFGRAPHADLRLTALEHLAPPPAPRSDATNAAADSAPALPESLAFTVNDRLRCTLPMVGEHNALNALAALAVARRFALDHEHAAAGLAQAQPPEMRLQSQAIAGVRILNDAYNANPDSTLAALRTFAAIAPAAPAAPTAAGARRVLVLGDHLEQGEHAHPVHEELGRAVLDAGCFDLLITVGPLARLAARIVLTAWPPDRVVSFPSLDAPHDHDAARLLAPGDCLLLKGSRGTRLERLLDALRAAHPNTPPAPDAPAHPAVAPRPLTPPRPGTAAHPIR